MATPPPPSGNRCRSHVTTSPSLSPAASVPQASTTSRISMEQVWKEIKRAPLCDHGSSSSATTTNRFSARNVLLHDFTARPFTKHSSAVLLNACACNHMSSAAAQPTTLNLISFSSNAFYKHPNNSSLSSFDTSKSSTVTCPSNSKKRVRQDLCGSSDPRHQRIIKNRESAVRSRARKQEKSSLLSTPGFNFFEAYKNALELKLARLTEENSRLRQLVEELRLTSSAKHPKMRTLYRTATSPL